MKRLGMVVLGVGLLAAACVKSGAASLGSPPSGSGQSPTPTQSPSRGPLAFPSGSPSSSGRKLTFEVWFVRGGKLFVTKRTEPFNVAVGKLSLDALQHGPSASELVAGVTTEVPLPLADAGGPPGDFIGASLTITALASGIAMVDVEPPGPAFQQGTPAIRLEKAQIVYTLTQYSTINKVTFRSIDTNLYTRASFDDLLPAILVEGPVIGQRIPNPVTVSGKANVFEATVSLRILDENGKTVANTFTTATCGTGCRGDYSVSVPYSVDHEQQGTVEVYESSAKDGSAINVVDIPVTLTP